MAALQNFRSALNGFNREDVVHYIEYLNNTHASKIGQLTTELQTLQAELNELRNQPKEDNSALIAELEEAKAQSCAAEQALQEQKAQCTALEQELEALRNELAQAQQDASRLQTEEELEAYRRAERTERLAGERVAQLYQQANSVLADATVRVDETATQVSEMVDQVAMELSQLQTAVLASKSALKDAAAAMYAVRPINAEE